MSISVGFTTEAKKYNSTKQLTMSVTHQCNLKNGCSMLKPTLFLELQSDIFPAFTGFKIDNRYYTVTDIRSIRQHLFEIDGQVDVLATFKDNIGSSTQYVVRSSNQYNPYIKDMKYPALADTDLITTYLDGLAVDTDGTYVVGIVGIGESANMVKYYAFNTFDINSLLLALFSEENLDTGGLSIIGQEIQKELFNPFQYIVSCYWYPIDYGFFDLTHNAEFVHFGWWEAKYTIEGQIYQVSACRIHENKRIYSFEETFNPPKHPQAPTRGTYLNDAPYTRYTLNCYSFGSIALNPSPFVDGDAGAIEIDVDVFTGLAQLYVTTSSGRLFTVTSQFGVPIQINQNTANWVGLAVNAVEVGVGIASGNAVQTAKGIESSLHNNFPQIQTNGANGSKVAFMQRANITGEFRSIADEYNSDMGRPLCAPKVISTIPGYIECENVEIDLAATKEEKDKITSFMESGFFYE